MEVFTNLDKSLLLDGFWVPLNWDENEIVVLVYDPSDLEKQETIKTTLRTEWVIFAVGIKEEIEALINRSFNQLEIDDFLSQAMTGEKPIDVAKLVNIIKRAIRRLEYIDLATNLQDLMVPPSNRLHALKGDRRGQYSISINDQWRICFNFVDGDAYDVEITDYH